MSVSGSYWLIRLNYNPRRGFQVTLLQNTNRLILRNQNSFLKIVLSMQPPGPRGEMLKGSCGKID